MLGPWPAERLYNMTIGERIEARQDRYLDELVIKNMRLACTDVKTGVLKTDGLGCMIRGTVPKIKCGCGVIRFSDGTKCSGCKSYPSSVYVREGVAEEFML